MRVDSAKLTNVRGASRGGRWAAWLLCGALVSGGVALVPRLRAEAPADKGLAPTDIKLRPRPSETKSRHTQRRPAKTPPKPGSRPAVEARGSAREKKKQERKRPARHGSVHSPRARQQQMARRARSTPRAAKAAEAQELDVATGLDEACHVQLRRAGVPFVKVLAERAPEVRLPIRLTGNVAEVEIRGTGKNKATYYLDCRLALALVRWAPQLQAAGVVRIDHYSIYRPDAEVGATRKLSAHAVALAIDAARFHLRDGRVLSVLDTWMDKTKGADPCAARPRQGADEQLLRELVCNAARHGIFQTIVTPHHNPEHDNHVHLEISSSFAPTWIH